MSRKCIALWALPVLLALSAYGEQAAEAPKPGFNFFSRQQDVQLGQEAAQQVRKQYQVVRTPFLQEYIRRIGDRLAATSYARNSGFKFTFTLLNDPQVNAFALPGGPMFIFTGLIKATDNEAQLAGVMSHEMSHVILRHGTHEASKANLVELPLRLAQLAAGDSIMGRLVDMGLGFGANSFVLKFSRDAEAQADALGARIMAEAGYNPLELARFFKKLEASGGQGNSAWSQFLSDHPNPGNRVRAIEEEAQTLPPERYGYQTGEFERAKADVLSLPPAPKRKSAG
jgi:predicted Zn-dependent protease